jgi:hypothetical protein
MSEQNEFGKLFPHLSSDERAAAKEILDAYLLLAWEIWEERSARVRQDQEHSTTINNPQLTAGSGNSSIQVKVDSLKIN